MHLSLGGGEETRRIASQPQGGDGLANEVVRRVGPRGLRRGEPSGEVSRTTVGGRIVEGDPKTKRGKRTLPLGTELLKALSALRGRQSKERLAAGPAYDGADGKVVADELDRPPRPEWYSVRFRNLARQAGVPVIRLHDVRHTSVTIMRSLGHP